jgi:dCMP deaminase
MSAKWDIRFLEQARFIAGWSKDPSTRVGAVIADGLNRVVSQGFNGLAKSVKDTQSRLNDRAKKYPMVIHAELNAILFAQRDLRGCTLYSWPMPPCAPCAGPIIQVGITRVVSVPPTVEQIERWGNSHELAREMFREAGVTMVYPPFGRSD